MDKKSKIFQIIKSDIKDRINDIGKIIEYDGEELDDSKIQEKISKISKKLQPLETRSESATEINNNHNEFDFRNNIFDQKYDDYRSYNIFIPKICIQKTARSVSTLSNFNINIIDKSDNNILKNSTKEAKNFSKEDFLIKKSNKLNKFKQDFSFFNSTSVEYTYQDKDENFINFKKPNRVFKAYKIYIEGRIAKNQQISSNSVNLNKYAELFNFSEKSKFLEFDERRRDEDQNERLESSKTTKIPNNSSGRKKKNGVDLTNELIIKQNNQSVSTFSNVNIQSRDNLESQIQMQYSESFKNWFKEQNNQLIMNNDKPNEYKKEKKEKTFTSNLFKTKNLEKDKSFDISFGINVNFPIFKYTKLSCQEGHPRILQIQGPKAIWFRYKDDMTSHYKKGEFDLRESEVQTLDSFLKDKSNKSIQLKSIPSSEDKIALNSIFVVSKKKRDPPDSEKFWHYRFRRFNKDVDYLTLFIQIKKYYDLLQHMLVQNQNSIDYNKIKYLSDPDIKEVILYKENPSEFLVKTLETFEWHKNLKNIHFQVDDKKFWKSFFTCLLKPGNEMKLEIMSLGTKDESLELGEDLLGFMKEYFFSSKSQEIVELHFFDLIFSNKLFEIIDVLIQNKKEKSEQDKKLALRKLTFKINPDKKPVYLDITELKNLLKNLGSEKTVEDVFESLDISGMFCKNIEDFEGIFYDFGLVRELNISRTKTLVYNTQKNKEGKEVLVGSEWRELINDINFLKLGCRYEKFLEKKNCSQDEISILTHLYVMDTIIKPESFAYLMKWIKNFKFLNKIFLRNDQINEVVTNFKREDENLEYNENIVEIEYEFKKH